MNKLTAFLLGCVLIAGVALAQVYNLFQPGGDLAGAGSTWNSQIIANNAITTAKINAAAVDLTTKVTGLLPVANGGSGVATLTGLVVGNGASAFSAYAGTSCTNQFPRSFSAAGVATCATVANTDLANSAITINGTSVALGGTRTLTLASADFANQGTATTVLHGNAAGNPSFAAVANADLANSSITINGTSTALGGTRTLTLASADYVNQGTTTTVLHGNAAGNPSFGAVSLTTDVSGVLPAANGGTGSASAIILSGTTGSIGGGALLAGQCSSGTVTITGATTSMVALADPQTYPGDGTIWDATVTSADTVTVKICAIVALSPGASLYNVRVLR